MHRYIGRHADELGSGRPIEPGEAVPFDQGLHDRGLLVPISEEKKDGKLRGEALEARVRELGIEGTSTMSADEKRAAITEAENHPTNEEG